MKESNKSYLTGCGCVCGGGMSVKVRCARAQDLVCVFVSLQ